MLVKFIGLPGNACENERKKVLECGVFKYSTNYLCSYPGGEKRLQMTIVLRCEPMLFLCHF